MNYNSGAQCRLAALFLAAEIVQFLVALAAVESAALFQTRGKHLLWKEHFQWFINFSSIEIMFSLKLICFLFFFSS